jgi:hypothetical protein
MQERVDEVVQTVVRPDHFSVLNAAQREAGDGIEHRAGLVELQRVQIPEGEALLIEASDCKHPPLILHRLGQTSDPEVDGLRAGCHETLEEAVSGRIGSRNSGTR